MDKAMLATLLKSIGFGMVVTGVADGFLNDDPASPYYNTAIAVIGFAGWATGQYLESRELAPPPFWPTNSTDLIKRALTYATGTGVATGLIHLIKQTGPNSAALGNIGTGIFLTSAIQELNLILTQGSTKLKWEKLRFAILTVGDYLTGAAMKKVVNGESLDLFSIISLPLGFLMVISEGVYTYKNDIKPIALSGSAQLDQARLLSNLFRSLNKRAIKLTVGLGSLFTLQDILMSKQDKYSISSDAYVMLTNVFLFAALMEMRRIAIAQNAQAASAVQSVANNIVEMEDELGREPYYSLAANDDSTNQNASPRAATTTTEQSARSNTSPRMSMLTTDQSTMDVVIEIFDHENSGQESPRRMTSP
jgi:hypothetical protein